MHLINSHRFANDALFEMYHLGADDHRERGLPECDVVAFYYNNPESMSRAFLAMRPDEALILARLLIDAVCQVTEGYDTNKPHGPIAYESVQGVRKPLKMEIAEDGPHRRLY
jgi:hypothetical protein